MLIHTPAELAQFYRDQRKLHGQSQTVMAQEAGLRQDTVSKFEISPDNTRLDTLFRLLAALDLELHVKSKGGVGSDSDNSEWNEPW